jgi:hypothetical protein
VTVQVRTVGGKDPNNVPDRYMTRAEVGQAWAHVFWRPDRDEWHDHAMDFWTFPLKGYSEEVMFSNGEIITRRVAPWRVHFRHAEHAHRIVDADSWPVVTLVWAGPKRRKWGFLSRRKGGGVVWVPWRTYLFPQVAFARGVMEVCYMLQRAANEPLFAAELSRGANGLGWSK